MALVTRHTRHWSGKHGAVVQGINLISLVWTDGDCCLPCDYRLYHKTVDGLDKNDHFRAMLQTAHERGFAPVMVAFDGWYSSLDNLKLLRQLGWPCAPSCASNSSAGSLSFPIARPNSTSSVRPFVAIVHIRPSSCLQLRNS